VQRSRTVELCLNFPMSSWRQLYLYDLGAFSKRYISETGCFHYLAWGNVTNSLTIIPLQLDPNGYRSRFVFGSFMVRTAAGTSAILTEIFCCFPQSLQVNSGIVPQIGHDHFLPNSSQFSISNRPRPLPAKQLTIQGLK
jgi:hypothetical protein